MKRLYLTLIFMAAVLSSCKLLTGPEETDGNMVYYSSFEFTADTTGWHGISADMFVNTPSPAGGHKSLHVGGGCAQPAAWLVVNVQPGKYKLSFWGRVGSANMCAGIMHRTSDSESSTMVTVTDTSWKYYTTEVPIQVTNQGRLVVDVYAGGFIPNDIFIDNLKIEKAD